MQSLTLSEFKTLVSSANGPHLSLYQPTHTTPPDLAQDPIRFKNLLNDAESKLEQAGMRAPEARALLAPGRDLLDNSFFWRRQSAGLAVFARPESFRVFRLPVRFDESVAVSDRFQVVPLIPLLQEDGRYLVLAINLHGVKLYECTRHAWQELALSESIASVAEELRAFTSEKELQFHTQTPRTPSGERSAVFHGHGDPDDKRKEQIMQALRQIDRELQPHLREERAPLILAGVAYLAAMYRQVNQYPHILDQELTGSLEQTSAPRLQEEGWVLAEPVFRQKRNSDLALFQEAHAKNRGSDDLQEILTAAQDARVAILFGRAGAEVWGVYAPQTRKLLTTHEKAEPGDEHLINAAVVQTLATGGSIHILDDADMPTGQPAAAYFRW